MWERRLSSRRKERMGISPRDSGVACGDARRDAQRTALEHGCERDVARGQGNGPRSGTGRSLVRMTGVGACKTPFPDGAYKTPPVGSGGFPAAERSGWASAPATPRWRVGTPVGMPGERPMNMVTSGTSRGGSGYARTGTGRSLVRMTGVGAYKTPLPWGTGEVWHVR